MAAIKRRFLVTGLLPAHGLAFTQSCCDSPAVNAENYEDFDHSDGSEDYIEVGCSSCHTTWFVVEPHPDGNGSSDLAGGEEL